MSIDHNEFFRQMTKRICASLDIQRALESSFDYLKSTSLPLNFMALEIYQPGKNAFFALANAADDEKYKFLNIVLLPENLREMVNKRVDTAETVWIINRPEADPEACLVLQHLDENTAMSFLFVRLEIEGNRIGLIILGAEGHDRYTQAHAGLLGLLHDPFAIATANALRYREVLRLKDMLADDNRYLQGELRNLTGSEIVGANFGLKPVMDMVGQVAAMDSPVLLMGETGVGKEVVAGAIHRLSPRSGGPFIRVNCGAIPDALIDSELFGHEKGAFTGASTQKRGRFERASGGTIFLDEIGELPLHAQVRLLNVLQNREIERVGGTSTIPVDIRIVSATHRDLPAMVAGGQFREDLWFRLNVFPIMIPPLRQRKADIPALAHFFIEQKIRELKLDVEAVLAPGAMDRLVAYDWPGNVRELQNIVERALIRRRDGYLSFDNVAPDSVVATSADMSPPADSTGVLPLDEANRRYIEAVLHITHDKIAGTGGAAALLHIHPNTLRKRMAKLGIAFGRRRRQEHPT